MGFKKFEEYFPPRFKEFDEARKYIENIDTSNELTYEAIDYMIAHREYYFLLKNIIRQFGDNNEGTESFFEYLFSRMDKCPERDDDFQLYREIILSKNQKLKIAFMHFVRKCSKEFKEFAKELLKEDNKHLKHFGFCILVSIPDDEKTKEILKKYVLENKINKYELEEFIEYIYFYGNKEDKECLKKLMEKFPEFKDKIRDVEDSL
ncbi:MAG: hypothetical protein DSY47_01250 [Hydrogenothermus sp.]|nr:MAG: hypothetical protein DSY47_01250 [Hydrogenothermus sp.]